jgi:hypothetical protein
VALVLLSPLLVIAVALAMLVKLGRLASGYLDEVFPLG